MTTQIRTDKVGRKEDEGRINREGGQEGKQSRLASEDYPLKAMPSLLGTFDMTAIYLTTIFFITNVTTAVSGGAATFTYFILGGCNLLCPLRDSYCATCLCS